MQRFRASLVLAVLLAPVLARGQQDTGISRFVSPNATALISIDWARIRESPAGTMIRQKLLKADAQPAIPGLELLNDIDRVLISASARNSADESAEQPFLIAIQGHFDSAKVRQFFTHLGAKPQSYSSFQVYRPQGKDAKDSAWVLVDTGTILFGDAPLVFAALDRSQFTQRSPQAGSIIARAAEMDANYEFWAIMSATDILSSDWLADRFPGGEWASEARGFEMGVNLRAGLAAEITLRFSSDDAAKRVAAEVARVINAAARDKSVDVQAQNIAKKLKFSLDGPAARISLRLTQQELEKSAQAFAASGKVSASAAAKPPVQPVVTRPAVVHPAVVHPAVVHPAMIRIEGLDEGTREIPYPQPEH